MCGIAGIVTGATEVPMESTVRRMLSRIEHRGPDDEGVAVRGSGAIGVRRLSIIDIAGGHQPMANESGSVFAVQNGEIYNFRQIRDDLIRRGHHLRTRSDTEILPHAYEEWGEELVHRLSGMFAIAIWDADRRSLLLVRDRFGKKPLFYACLGDTLIFGSEIQALLTLGLVAREPDDEAIDEYLTFGYIAAPRSGFAAIKKVPPGHTLTFQDGRLDVKRYWRLRFTPKSAITTGEAEAELRRCIDRAVAARLVSDVPVGAFLSGGLDSSTVVAYMARHSTEPVKTFAIGFRDSTFDELAYARLVAQMYGTEHHELVVDAEHTDVLPMLVRHLGEPFADSSIVPTFQVARITKSFVTVALTGDGGDEMFGGYDRYRAAAIAHLVTSRLPESLKRTLAAAADGARLPAQLPRSVHRARRFVAALGMPPQERYLRWGGYFTGSARERIVGERMRPFTVDRAAERLREAAELTGATDAAELYMATDSLNYLPYDLLVKVDISSMACSLEARSPLLDHDLAGFVATLPVRYKLSPLRSKLLLRRAMRGVVPDAILDRRRKMGFSAPVGAWLRGPLREMLGDIAAKPEMVKREFVSQTGFNQLVDQHVGGRADHSMAIWNLFMLELWLREVVQSS